MLLYCIRHGETEFNAAGRIQGQLDSPLSKLGYRQCESAAQALAGLPIEAIVASPLKRAADSARAFAEQFSHEIRFDPQLMEINAGVFQGHCWPEIETAHPEDSRRWRSQDPDFCIPGGESRRALMERVRAAFEAIRATGLQQVVVVAHGGSLAAALKSLLEIPPQRNPFSLQNGSITRIAWNDRDVKLLSLNEIGHLNGLVGSGGDL